MLSLKERAQVRALIRENSGTITGAPKTYLDTVYTRVKPAGPTVNLTNKKLIETRKAKGL